MGCCSSKNDPNTLQNATTIETNPTEIHNDNQVSLPYKKKPVFVIQHNNSTNDSSTDPTREPKDLLKSDVMTSGKVASTSSCTKEEIDAILIQCGRLSKSSSGNGPTRHRRRFSGSKRSFDFDKENDVSIQVNYGEDDGCERPRWRPQSLGSHRRRATLSRSRERDQTPQPQQQRSGSRERSQSNGRRVSWSPVRRSGSPIISHSGNINNSSGNVRPGKLVSVPATVTSLTADKGSNVNAGDVGTVKRVLVRRNVGSPRSQSPARAQSPGCSNGNGGQQVVSISRNGSRKRECSPYRRTPLSEIDMNSSPFHPLSDRKVSAYKVKETEEDVVVVKQPGCSEFQENKLTSTNNAKASCQGTHRRTRSRGAEGEVTKTYYCRVNEQRTLNVEQMADNRREQLNPSAYDVLVTPVVVSGTNTTLKLPQTLIRSRSGRRSRSLDLDINVEALLAPNPATNYNSLLLQDIQNFHQKKNSNSNVNSCNNAISTNIDSSTPPFTLPACVSKARSILQAVADLNSTTVGSNFKCPRESNLSFHNVNTKRVVQLNDPIVESEVKLGDDLMEPNLHKYVTVRKKGGDMDDDVSSKSFSFAGGGCLQNWVSSSLEPTSANPITDSWVSKPYSHEEVSPVGFQRHAISNFGCGIYEESERKFSKAGVAQSRAVAARGPIPTTKPAAATM